MTYTLDASSVLRFLDKEAGADRVYRALQGHLDEVVNALISAIQWGEIIGILTKRHGILGAQPDPQRLEALYLTIIPVSARRAEEAALIKLRYGIPYADSFAAQLARSTNSLLITADFDFDPARGDIAIEILPTKPKP